jgi:hypothetical protein
MVLVCRTSRPREVQPWQFESPRRHDDSGGRQPRRGHPSVQRACGGRRNGAWIISTQPSRLFSRNQAITALALAERLAVGYGGDDPSLWGGARDCSCDRPAHHHRDRHSLSLRTGPSGAGFTVTLASGVQYTRRGLRGQGGYSGLVLARGRRPHGASAFPSVSRWYWRPRSRSIAPHPGASLTMAPTLFS